jgi:hypothetical protein
MKQRSDQRKAYERQWFLANQQHVYQIRNQRRRICYSIWKAAGLCIDCQLPVHGSEVCCDTCRKIRANKKALIHDRVRTLVLKHYGDACACCGEDQPEFLAIDHVENNGAAHRREIGNGDAILYWIKRHNFPAGFQLLCHNCNMAKEFYGVCPHSGNRRFKRRAA